MRKIFFSCWLYSIAIAANAQNWAYSLDNVPATVKEKATVIVHLEEMRYEVESVNKASITVRRIFTVVNEEGKDALFFNQYSSGEKSLTDAEIKVYDKNGKQLAKYKKKDMRTVAIGEGLVEEGSMTYLPIETATYPVTLEVQYVQKYRSTLNTPNYRFIGEKEGIVASNFTAIIPVDMTLRYKAENTAVKPEVTESSKVRTYKWTVTNLAPIEYEEGAVSYQSRYPHIKIAVDRFSHYGLQGDLSSWSSFGLWLKNLYEGLDELAPDRRQYFMDMVRDADNDREKIRRIYSYMQNNFRYVSIQLGIGGLKPFSADFTDKKKYGDCKALSNYMKAALKAVGINSHLAIINAEFNQLPVDPDFPSNEFNHVILCVPGDKDSVWLECTSSTAAFGELGTFTENRNALLITETGGVLTPTPRSRSAENILSTFTMVELYDDMSATTETRFKTRGEYREMMDDILKEKKDHQKAAVVQDFGFKQPDNFELLRDETEGSHARLKMAIRKVPDFNAGSKWFINPRMYKIWSARIPKATDRKLDFYFRFPFEKYDTTAFRMSVDFTPDVLPAGKELDNKYASYRSFYWYNAEEKTLYSASSLILKQHVIPAAEYAAVKKFFEDVVQEDAQKIVIKVSEREKKAF